MPVMLDQLWFVVIIINLVSGELISRHDDFRLTTCSSDKLSRLQAVRRFDDVSTLVTCAVYCTHGESCSAIAYDVVSKDCQLYVARSHKVDTIGHNVTHQVRCWVRTNTAPSEKEIKPKAKKVRIHDYKSPLLTRRFKPIKYSKTEVPWFGNIITFLAGQVSYLVTFDWGVRPNIFRIRCFKKEVSSESLKLKYLARDVERLTDTQVIASVEWSKAVIVIDVFPTLKLNRTIQLEKGFVHIGVLSEELVVLGDGTRLFLLNMSSSELSPSFRPNITYIQGIAISPDNNLLLANNKTLILYSMSGDIIWKYSSEIYTEYCRFDGMGNIAVASFISKYVALISGQGTFLKIILKKNSGWYNRPSYLTFDELGDIYISDMKSNLIIAYHFS